MHGEIRLESELGNGTKTTFWIQFKNTQIMQGDPALAQLRPAPTRGLSEMSVSRHSSGRQSVGDDPQISSSDWQDPSSVSKLHLGHTSGACVQAPNKEDSTEDDLSSQDIDRSSINILVVEDK